MTFRKRLDYSTPCPLRWVSSTSAARSWLYSTLAHRWFVFWVEAIDFWINGYTVSNTILWSNEPSRGDKWSLNWYSICYSILHIALRLEKSPYRIGRLGTLESAVPSSCWPEQQHTWSPDGQVCPDIINTLRSIRVLWVWDTHIVAQQMYQYPPDNENGE